MWRFQLLSLPDRAWVDRDLILAGAEVSTGISAPASISGRLMTEVSHLMGADGLPVVREWGCGIVAQYGDQEPIFGIVDRVSSEGQSLGVEAGGFSMYPTGQPWLGEDFAGVQVDPLDMLRKIWAHLQSYPDGNLRVSVDSLKSPVRVGEEERTVEFTTGAGEAVEFETGPFRLAWWATDDLGKVQSDLVADTPFEYREHSSWDGEGVKHRLELGYPVLGVRRHELRFEIGVNVTAVPASEPSEYASEVLLMGAGEGRTKVRSHASRPLGRLRRVHVDTDSSLTSKRAAETAARPMLEAMSGAPGIKELVLTEHPSAPYGSYQPGDEIQVLGDMGWARSGMWVRIQEISADVDSGDIRLQVVMV